MKPCKPKSKAERIYAISGGPDSVYLAHREAPGRRDLFAHFNHGARGKESDADERFCRRLAADAGLKVVVGRATSGPRIDGAERITRFELQARRARHDFLKTTMMENGAREILMAHTADDQVETILMRIFEGAGIAGLKGIPRETSGRLKRPILDVWREDIDKYLKKNNISCRTDSSNGDTRFERNWIRRILIPLLVERYGKAVKKRIHILGERFRELDRYLEDEAVNWIKKYMKTPMVIPRKDFGLLPQILRIRVLQAVCYRSMDLVPNERLLSAMDRLIASGGPSDRIDAGHGWVLRCRYDEAVFAAGRRKGSADRTVRLRSDMKEALSPARARRLALGERAGVFDANSLAFPLSVRPLRSGDRIHPFGLKAEKKVKEILIDRKIPRDERWGRPVVCDASGAILWIPGVVRSALAPVTSRTRKSVVLRIEA